MRAPLLAALMLAAPLLAALPAGAAPARLALEFPPVPELRPGQELTLRGNLTYGYDATSPNLTEVTLVPRAGPLWLNARLDPSLHLLAAADRSGRTVAPVNLTVGVRPGTAALLQHTLDVRVEAGPNPPLEPVEATAGVVVRVAFLGQLRVEPVELAVRARPGEPAVAGVRIVNEGNGPARVSLDVASEVPGLVVVAPPPVVVAPEAAARERVVNVSVLAERTGRFPVPLRFASAHAFDSAQRGAGGELTFTLEVAEQGVPGFEGLLALAGLGLTAAARRCRR